MIRELQLNVLTPRRLLSREEAVEALDLVCNVYPDIAPEKYGWWEPLREQFDPTDLEPILRNWRDMFIWKRRKPNVEGWISPSLSGFGGHSEIYIAIDASKADLAGLIRFVQEASSRFGADFGFLHIPTEPEVPTSRANKTLLDVNPYFLSVSGRNLKRNVPDLYWASVFGGVYIEHFGRERLLSAPAHIVKELPGGCIYLQLSESIFDLKTDYEKVDEVRKRVKEHLNCNSFFDLSLPVHEYHVYNVPKFKLIPDELFLSEEIEAVTMLTVEPEVTEDADLLALVQGLCDDAVSFARKQFSLDLDFSEQSVEPVLEKVYEEAQSYLAMLGTAKGYRNNLSRSMGAYMGEVLRRKAGGSGIWYWESKAFAPKTLLALRIGNETMFPLNEVYKRLDTGPEPEEPEVVYDSDLFIKVQGLCLDAMKLAKETYLVDLDFSEKSVELVEQILGKAYDGSLDYLAMPEAKPELAEDYFKILSDSMGAYIGEVLRRQAGGIWYWEKKAFAPTTLLALRIGNETIFPLNKVYKRLTNGPEDDVHFYFQVMKSKAVAQKNTNTDESKPERSK